MHPVAEIIKPIIAIEKIRLPKIGLLSCRPLGTSGLRIFLNSI